MKLKIPKNIGWFVLGLCVFVVIAADVTTTMFDTTYFSATDTKVTLVGTLTNWSKLSTNAAGGSAITALTGDVTATGPGSAAATLAAAGTAGTYRSVTTDAKGRVTAGTAPTTIAGYGLTDAVNKAGDTMTGPLVPPSYSLSTLPASSSGANIWCSDCVLPLGTGGLFYYDGANWRNNVTGIKSANTVPSFLRNCLEAGWTGVGPNIAGDFTDEWGDTVTGRGAYWSFTVASGSMASTSVQDQSLLSLGTSASINNSTAFIRGQSFVPYSDFFMISASLAPLSDSNGSDNFYTMIGFDISGNATVGTHTCSFVYDLYKGSAVGSQISATNNWQCVTGTNGVWTVTDSGVAHTLSPTNQQFSVIYTPKTNAVFWINGVAVATNTTNLPDNPSNALYPIIGVKKTATSVAGLKTYVDWAGVYKYWGTARNFR